jgi:hypothetical protein
MYINQPPPKQEKKEKKYVLKGSTCPKKEQITHG